MTEGALGRELASSLSLQERKDLRAKHPSLGGVEFGNRTRKGRAKPGEKKTTIVFGENKKGAGAAAELHNLRMLLKDTEQEIAADEESCKEMRRHIAALEVEKGKIEAKIAEDEKFVAAMCDEKSLGGVMKQFDGMQGFLEKAYNRARGKHKDGIELLKKEFGYHPAYRLGREGEFSATYFTPDPDPTNYT